MAPELQRDKQSNEKSDVYSFGVILWERLTFQQPRRNLPNHRSCQLLGLRENSQRFQSMKNSLVATLIEECWANETLMHSCFCYIVEFLQQLMKISQLNQLMHTFNDLPTGAEHPMTGSSMASNLRF